MLKDDAYHNFGWLRDIRDYGGAAGRSLARRVIIEKWCKTHNNGGMSAYIAQIALASPIASVFTLSWFGES